MTSPDLLLSDLSQAAADDRWRGFSDRVMGGISREQVSVEELAGRRCIRLRGEVRLENNGGFVQMALPLDAGGESFDADDFQGIRLLALGNNEEYLVHLRTTQTRLPWQYFRAPFVAGPAWHSVDIPFTAFQPERIAARLDPRRLSRLGIVAYGRRFTADVAVAQVSLYR
jgi:hypothetical protein